MAVCVTLRFEKTPSDRTNFTVDWGEWLDLIGDEASTDADFIQSSDWEIVNPDDNADPNKLAIADNYFNPTQATVVVSGGVENKTYCLRNTITTNFALSGTRDIQIGVLGCVTYGPNFDDTQVDN